MPQKCVPCWRPVSEHNSRDGSSRKESHVFLLNVAPDHCLHREERDTLSPAAREYLGLADFNTSPLLFSASPRLQLQPSTTLSCRTQRGQAAATESARRTAWHLSHVVSAAWIELMEGQFYKGRLKAVMNQAGLKGVWCFSRPYWVTVQSYC